MTRIRIVANTGVWVRGLTFRIKACAGKRLVNSFTGEEIVVPENGRIPLARLFAEFPVTMLRG